MIIDFHCHIFHGMTDADRAVQAARLSRIGIGHGLHKKTEEIFAGLSPLIDDPSGEKLIRGMDDAKIDVSICFIIDNIAEGLDDNTVLRQNKSCAELAKRYAGRIVPFAGIDPRRPKAPEILRKCIEEFGMKGIKFHPDKGYSPVCEEAYKVLRMVQEYNIIFMSHTGPVPPPRRNKFTHPLLLDDIGCDFPNLKIVAAHTGGLWQHEWAVVATFSDNIYGDLAEWQLDAVGRYQRFCRNLRELLDMVGPNKLLFATDWPAFEPFISAKDWVNIIRRLPQDAPPGIQFTTEEVNAILGGNARKILGI